MEFAADSTSLLKIFIFPTLLNQNSIYSSLFRLPCCDLVVISPLHYFFSLAEFPWSCRLGNLDLSILLRSRVFYFLEISLFLDLAGCNFSYSRLADEFTVGLGPTGMTISYYLWIGIILLYFLKSPHRIFAPRNSLALWMLKRSVLAARFRLWFGVFGLVYGTVIWDISLDTGVRIAFSQSVLNESIEPFWGLTKSWRCWWMDTRGERIIERYILSVPALPYSLSSLRLPGVWCNHSDMTGRQAMWASLGMWEPTSSLVQRELL